MIDGQDYKRLLHSHRMKSTKPRNAVLSVLGEKDCALTAEEIYRALVQKGDGVNFSTVYRVLELFAEKRLVTKTFFSDSRSYGFSLKTAEHMHHLICMKCHRRIDISHCPLGDFECRVAAETGFDIRGHNLELFGYCSECRPQGENT